MKNNMLKKEEDKIANIILAIITLTVIGLFLIAIL
jgi:hypothetical protein